MKKIKVLHVVSTLKTGGIETWLLNVSKNIDRSKFQFDFLSISNEEGIYENELTALGCSIYRFTSAEQKDVISFIKQYKKIVTGGAYTIVHLHRYLYNGFFSIVNYFLKVITISHSHTNRFSLQQHKSFKEKALFYLDNIFSNYKLGCSIEALNSAYYNKKHSEVIYYGIDVNKFTPAILQEEIIGIDENTLQLFKNKIVIGHVGRFVDVKNHDFIIDIAKLVNEKHHGKFLFVLIGNGPLQEKIKKRIQEENLQNLVLMLGVRKDVHLFFNSVLDCFILPSLFEGLGIVLLESQCAGVPIIVSSNITTEVDVLNHYIIRLKITDASEWVEKISQLKKLPLEERLGMHQNFIKSNFSITTSTRHLESFYLNIINS